METVEIEMHGIPLIVTGTFSKGEDEVMYYSDMSGHPGSPPEFETDEILLHDTNIIELLSEELIVEIQEKCLEKLL